MSEFKLEKEERFGNIDVNLFSYTEQQSALSRYIQSKVQQPASNFSNLLENYASSNIDKDFLLQKFNELNTPANHTVPTFDVKRSTVTEFMAEYLLEKEFQCIFFEETNKKLNKSMIDTSRHTTGVDVVGIQQSDNNLKFVVCEVKASIESKVPCQSANSLKQDIEKLLNFTNNRLISEIFGMSETIKSSSQMESYVKFLLELISSSQSQNKLIENLIIFPFLIRQNSEILKKKNLNDFKDFSQLDTKNVETIGIIWAINKNLDAFVESIFTNG